MCRTFRKTPEVTVTTAAGVYGPAISQWVLAVMLYHAQRLDQVLTFKASRAWPATPTLVGTLVAGQTLGIVGYGSIGRECARLGRALGMRVLATRSGGADAAPMSETFVPGLLDQRTPLAEAITVLPPDGLHRLLNESDYLVLAADSGHAWPDRRPSVGAHETIGAADQCLAGGAS